MPTLPDSGVSFTVQTNGQTLIVSAGQTMSALTTPLFSDAACTASVTTPQTITSDTTYYLTPDWANVAPYVSVKQPDGTELWGKSQHLGGIVIAPLPSAAQIGADVSSRNGLSLAPTGAIAETFSRAFSTYTANSAALTSGTMFMSAIALSAGTTVSSATFTSATQAAVAPTNQWFALYTSALALVGQTADDTSTAWAANSAKTLSFATPLVTTYSGLYYLGILVAAGTVPSLAGGTMLNVVQNIVPKLSGTSTTTLTDTAPGTAGAITNSTARIYAYVS